MPAMRESAGRRVGRKKGNGQEAKEYNQKEGERMQKMH